MSVHIAERILVLAYRRSISILDFRIYFFFFPVIRKHKHTKMEWPSKIWPRYRVENKLLQVTHVWPFQSSPFHFAILELTKE